MSWLTNTPIAHRGLHGEDIPENSIPAFRAATDAGYAIECDVQLTRDGVPVVFHDRELSRLTRASGEVDRVRWTDLRDLHLDGTAHRIPRLGVVLDVIDGQVPLLIEIKNRTSEVGALESTIIDRLDGYEGPFAVQSFNPRSLVYVRGQRPQWPRGQIGGELVDVDTVSRIQRMVLKRLLLTWWSRPTFIAYEHDALPYWPVTLHRKARLPVLAWTVRSAPQANRVSPHADNVIFEQYRP